MRTGRPTFHAGLDLSGHIGDPVYAAAGGVVEHVFRNDDFTPMRGYGNVIVLRHPDLGIWTSYNHLSEIGIRAGDVVARGQRIGKIGNTTNGKFPGMGPHLHFEVRHAKADGSTPFPGPYGRYNINPELWLDSLGYDLVNMVLRPMRGVPCILGARPEKLAVLSRAVADRCQVHGLGDPAVPVPWDRVTSDQPELPADAYEPPATGAESTTGLAMKGTAIGAGFLIAGLLIPRIFSRASR